MAALCNGRGNNAFFCIATLGGEYEHLCTANPSKEVFGCMLRLYKRLHTCTVNQDFTALCNSTMKKALAALSYSKAKKAWAALQYCIMSKALAAL